MSWAGSPLEHLVKVTVSLVQCQELTPNLYFAHSPTSPETSLTLLVIPESGMITCPLFLLLLLNMLLAMRNYAQHHRNNT